MVEFSGETWQWTALAKMAGACEKGFRKPSALEIRVLDLLTHIPDEEKVLQPLIQTLSQFKRF